MIQIKGDGEKIATDWIAYRKWEYKVSIAVFFIGIAGLVVGLAWAFSPLVGR